MLVVAGGSRSVTTTTAVAAAVVTVSGHWGDLLLLSAVDRREAQVDGSASALPWASALPVGGRSTAWPSHRMAHVPSGLGEVDQLPPLRCHLHRGLPGIGFGSASSLGVAPSLRATA